MLPACCSFSDASHCRVKSTNADWSLIQILEDLLDNTSKAVDIYSALRDPIKGYVRLFLEFYPTHPRDKKEDEPQPFAHEVFKGCIFSHYRNFSQAVLVTASDVSCSALRPLCLRHVRS